MTAPTLMARVRELARGCRKTGDRLAVAESCTGGGLAAALTSIAGSSDWFDRGFVTYSNEAKQEMLGVSAATLRRQGAVSEAVAREMARGALKRSRATRTAAITGIAGPGGGTVGKPVGLVWIAWARKGSVRTRRFHFKGGRAAVRRQSVRAALEGLLGRGS
jgi:nicotinamide-nucleotide amidase